MKKRPDEFNEYVQKIRGDLTQARKMVNEKSYEVAIGLLKGALDHAYELQFEHLLSPCEKDVALALVGDRLKRDYTYSSVALTLNINSSLAAAFLCRLCKKGIVSRNKANGHKYFYWIQDPDFWKWLKEERAPAP